MRRLFALLLLTPLMASCADSAMPVAPAGAVLSEGEVSTEGEWPAEENWFTPGDVLTLEDAELADQGMSAQSADAPKPAVMVLGNPEAGTSYPPGKHDQSFHARDRMIPGTVVINSGETVTFQVKFGHRVAIYNDGMKPEDILPNAGPFVLYPVNRLYLQPLPAPQIKLRFLKPGKYLVVCAIKSHFFDANMWGWVIVR
jgi:plastocyanin